MSTSLIVHAGLRPGELFIQRTDWIDTGYMVILPPAKLVAHFDIQAGRDGTWSLVRKQGGLQSPVVEEILVEFDSQEQAKAALLELTGLLMQVAPEAAAVEQPIPGKSPGRQINMRWGLAALSIAALVCLAMFVMSLREPGGNRPDEQAIPASSKPAATIEPASNPAGTAVIPAPAQDNRKTEPANNESLSPGDEFARMINGG